MQIGRRALIGAGLGIGLLAAGSVQAGQRGDPPLPAKDDPESPVWPPRERFALWPGRPPGAPAKLPHPDWTMNGSKGERQLWVRGVPMPELSVFRAAKPDGSALLVIPGGGYEFLSVQNEGFAIASRFAANGTNVFLLTYRLPGEGWANRHLVPLQDAQRAMRVIRARARDFDLDPARLGIIGFSAGGHLAADLASASDEHVYEPIDAADRQSARPAYAGLIYPVISFDPRITHSGSRERLLGVEPSQKLVDSRSPLRHVTPGTPPSFILHSFDDGTVPVDNAIEWIAACRAAKISVEGHLFAEGGHGYGLRLARNMPGSHWPELFETWRRGHGG